MKQTSVKNNARKGCVYVALFSVFIFDSAMVWVTELLGSSYDISRRLFMVLNSGFQKPWAQQNPSDKLIINQSQAGSSKQALAIVVVFDTDGCGATRIFVEPCPGEVLTIVESELNNIRKECGSDKYEVIVLLMDILVGFPLTGVGKNVAEKVAIIYLNYLYSSPAPQVVTRVNCCVYHNAAMEVAKSQFLQTKLFRGEDQFGGWPQVISRHFPPTGVLDKLLAEGYQ
ncbi:MAG: hypothetical protein RL248_1223 [Pseudomonadota bacterium]